MAVEEILNLKLTPAKQRSVAQMVTETVRSARMARTAFDDQIAACWERFEGLPPRRTLPFDSASNIRILLTYWTVRSVWVRIMRTVFGQSPTIRVGDENESIGPPATRMEQALEHLNTTDLKLRATSSHLFLNSLVEGTGVGKLLRATDERMVRDRGSLDMLGNLVPNPTGDVLFTRTVTDRIGLGLDVLDLKDFLVANPAVPDVNKQPWAAHHVWLRWGEIVQRQRDGIYTITKKQLDALKPLSRTRRWSGDQPLDQAKAESDRTEDQSGGYDLQEHPVWEAQWKWDIPTPGKPDGDGLDEECLFTVHEGQPEFPLRAQTSPWWNGKRNYLIYRPLPRANRFYGMSLAALMQWLQDEADTRLNQSLSAATLAILANLTPLLPRSLQSEWENHKWQLGQPIYHDAPEQFATLGSIMKHNPILAEVDLNRIFQLAERASGVTDPFQGRVSSGDTTATEITSVVQEGNITFSEMVEQVQGTTQELGYQVIEHAYQLAQESETFRQRLIRVCEGDPFEGTSLAEIRQRFDLRPTGNTVVANRDAETRKWLAIYQLLREEPLVNADLRRRWKVLEKVLRMSLPEEAPEQFIGTEEDAAQKQQEQQALAGVQMGMQVGQTLGQAGPNQRQGAPA